MLICSKCQQELTVILTSNIENIKVDPCICQTALIDDNKNMIEYLKEQVQDLRGELYNN